MLGDIVFPTVTVLQRIAACLASDAGDRDIARAWLEAHDRWLAWSGAVLGRSEGYLGWACYHRESGDLHQAREHVIRALDHATEPRQPLALLATHRLYGELDTDAGRYPDAMRHLGAALSLADACTAPYERALTLLALALHAVTRDRDEATAVLDTARSILESLGAKPALARADALAARLAALMPTPPVYPAGLSTREVEVLRLLAEGKSNQDIADALFLSVHTVRVHVRGILTKTGTDNRTAAAAIARQHGLA